MMVRTILEDQDCSQRPEIHVRTMYVDAEKMLTSLGKKSVPVRPSSSMTPSSLTP
jgi:hypothetical protein